MNNESEQLFDMIAAEGNNVDNMLKIIMKQKYTLLDMKKRLSEEYIMLNIVEQVINNPDNWAQNKKHSELTFYRRFSGLLDRLFSNTYILLDDDEAGCKSIKGPIQTNKAIFNVNESAYTYPRKIDLLLKLDDTTEVGLCSNEWKKTDVSDSVKLKQQNKNLQVNACIISSLQQYGIITTMALDFVGNAGYMYRMDFINNIYVAALVRALVILENPDNFIMFEDTLQLLFGFKYFLIDTSAILKQEVRKLSVKRQLSYIIKGLDDINHPQHMPYITFPHSKKRKTDEDQQGNITQIQIYI